MRASFFMTGFRIDLSQLNPGVSRVRLEGVAEELGLPIEEWPGKIVGDVSIRGKLEAAAWLECFRCLKHYESSISVPFDVFADRTGTGSKGDEEALERDDYMKFHDGRRLDLADDAREALLIELPMAPHCREDCAGLCKQCGADLNDGPCACMVEKLGLAPDNRNS